MVTYEVLMKVSEYTVIRVKISTKLGHLGGSVKRLTLAFGSGHDLTVCEFELPIGLCADSPEPAWDSLSLCLSLCLFSAHARGFSVSLSL